ncbi:hypothetical protein HPULCUR_010645 [Helicostylum pulchrum]|uniref:C2H2-type domain-containing protein n=1 Tax=Helicostylum pulchrum TaxID=562976 RepID=A0ABP9YFT0_9FUNG
MENRRNTLCDICGQNFVGMQGLRAHRSTDTCLTPRERQIQELEEEIRRQERKLRSQERKQERARHRAKQLQREVDELRRLDQPDN